MRSASCDGAVIRYYEFLQATGARCPFSRYTPDSFKPAVMHTYTYIPSVSTAYKILYGPLNLVAYSGCYEEVTHSDQQCVFPYRASKDD